MYRRGCTGGEGDAQGGEGGMHVHPVHPPWVRPCLEVYIAFRLMKHIAMTISLYTVPLHPSRTPQGSPDFLVIHCRVVLDTRELFY
jgi:hypothetical protein